MKISERASNQDSVKNVQLLAFLGNPLAELSKLQQEYLNMEDLLMLALGCMPLPKGQVCTLKEIIPLETSQIDEEETDTWGGSSHRQRSLSFAGNLLLSEEDDDFTPTMTRRRASTLKRANSQKPKLAVDSLFPLRLEKVDDVDEDMRRILEPFGGIQREILSLEAT